MNIVGCCNDTVTFVSKKYHIEYLPDRNRIPVEQYDLEGHYIQSFSSYKKPLVGLLKITILRTQVVEEFVPIF